MFLIYKNRGILIPVYLFVSNLGILILLNFLSDSVGGIFKHEIDPLITFGFGFMLAGTWTYLKRNIYVKTDGIRHKVDLINSFFFIEMKFWAIFFWAVGLIFLILAIYSVSKPNLPSGTG